MAQLRTLFAHVTAHQRLPNRAWFATPTPAEVQLQAILEATADGIIVLDAQRMPVVWNRTFQEIWRLPDNLDLAKEYDYLHVLVLQHCTEPIKSAKQFEAIFQDSGYSGTECLQLVDGRTLEYSCYRQWLRETKEWQVWIFRDITSYIQAERRAHGLITLGQQLNSTTTGQEAARVIATVADELLHWNSCFLELYDQHTDRMTTLLEMDVVDNERVEMPTNRTPYEPTFVMRMVMQEGAQLLTPTSPAFATLRQFGNTEYQSQSLLYVPVRHGALIIGIFSIQSYAPNAYTAEDLYTLQGLADHCGSALERIRTEEALRDAYQERQLLERKMLETQKRESLGVLAGGIAHDFNNLLTAMQGNIALAQLDLESTHPALESLQQAELAARRAADLTRQMLAYAGKSQLALDRIALNDVLEEMRGLLNASLPKQVLFDYQFGENLPHITADATQLRQVLLNLIVNATEAIDASDGKVMVRTRLISITHEDLVDAIVGSNMQPGSYVSLEIEDTGSGMESITLSRIFEPFFSTKFAGRGLGLAAVLGIVQSHSGAIRVRSAPGQGTRFQILLPPTEPPATVVPTSQRKRQWHGQGTALIIDDEPAIRMVTSRMVEQSGLTSRLARNGDEGVVIYQELVGDIALVMLDLTMPGRSTQQTLDAFHAIDPKVPILLMSGYTEQDAQKVLSHPQVVGFLHKPFRLADLNDALQGVLNDETM